MSRDERTRPSFVVVAALFAALTAGSSCAASPGSQASPDSNKLRVVAFDVDGGMAMLFVTPQGKSFLLDTGYSPDQPPPSGPMPPAHPSGAERIVATVKAAGLNKIDYLAISHYHMDHAGGVVDLAALIPIGTFLDHGESLDKSANPNDPNRPMRWEAPGLYEAYKQVVAGKNRKSMKAGEKVQLDDLTVTAINSGGKVSPTPLSGAGAPTSCPETFLPEGDLTLEDPNSLGIVAEWGGAKIVALGDVRAQIEMNTVCPRNLIGTADLLSATGHGSMRSNTREFLDNVKPRVVILNNGPVLKNNNSPKSALEKIAATPSVQGIWQVHYAPSAEDKNAPMDQIVNLDGPDARHNLEITVNKNGEITVVNPRNGFSKTYAKKP